MSDWPKTGDSLFGVGAWRAEALLGSFQGDGFYDYATAYKEAADALVEDLLSCRLMADSVVYPILFLYRHYIELILKGIIEIGSRLEKSSVLQPEHHKIDQLWQVARPLLERVFPEGDKTDTDAVETCIRELAKIDPSGERARYGRNKKNHGGGKTWTEPEQINLANMRDVMNGLATFLDGSYEGMDELLRCQHDIDADLTSELSD